MTTQPGKATKKDKASGPTAEKRRENLRYNQMMYGPTAKEGKAAPRKVTYGSAYLAHPKFQSLMTAFRKGTAYQFEVTDKGRTYAIATNGSDLLFDGKVLFYSRSMNRYEDHLLLDRQVLTQQQTLDALVHLTFAVLRSFPELEAPPLTYLQHRFYLGAELLEEGIATGGPNLLLGSYRHAKVQPRAKG